MEVKVEGAGSLFLFVFLYHISVLCISEVYQGGSSSQNTLNSYMGNPHKLSLGNFNFFFSPWVQHRRDS